MSTPSARSAPLPLALLPAALALLAASGAFAKAATQDPARLAKAHFYEKEAAESIRAGTIDPNEFLDGVPWQIVFTKPGKAQVDYGQESDTCALESESAGGASWTLSLRCGGGARTATWTWQGDGSAKTDLFDAARPEPKDRRTTTLLRLDREFNAVLAEVEKKFNERGIANLAGTWKDDAGAKLVLPAKGAAAFDGGRWAARVISCQVDPEKPKLQVPCVELAGPEEKSVVFAALKEDGATKLTEGSIPPDPAGRFFEKKSSGHVLVRAK